MHAFPMRARRIAGLRACLRWEAGTLTMPWPAGAAAPPPPLHTITNGISTFFLLHAIRGALYHGGACTQQHRGGARSAACASMRQNSAPAPSHARPCHPNTTIQNWRHIVCEGCRRGDMAWRLQGRTQHT